MSDTYTLGAVKIGNSVIKQILDARVDQGLQVLLARGSGALFNTFAAVGRYAPLIAFTSAAPKGALTACGLAGVKLTAAVKGILYFQQTTELGRVTAGCKTITISKGVAVWRSLNAPHLGQAAGVWEIYAASADGTASPYAEDSAQTMPDDEADELYVGGDASGSDLIQGWSLQTGIVVNQDYGDGKPWPQNVWIGECGPLTADVEMLKMQDLGDKAMATLKLLDNTQGGARGSSPITFTFNQELSHVNEIGGGGPLISRVRVTAIHDGTNLPVVVTGIS